MKFATKLETQNRNTWRILQATTPAAFDKTTLLITGLRFIKILTIETLGAPSTVNVSPEAQSTPNKAQIFPAFTSFTSFEIKLLYNK